MLIGELARRSGVTTSALRYYEREGLLPAPARLGNPRVYDARMLGRVNIISRARRRDIAGRKTQEIDALIERASQMKRLLASSFKCGCSTSGF